MQRYLFHQSSLLVEEWITRFALFVKVDPSGFEPEAPASLETSAFSVILSCLCKGGALPG